jgi:hypothetical protein
MAMDTYHVEYWTKDGTRVGLQISAYCSQDVIKYAEQMPNFNMIASFPDKIANG